MSSADVIIVGAGMVGSAIAYGLARQGQRVLAFDGDDTDYRAARANFGLVWVQGKGLGMPDYQRLTRRSSDQWPDFVASLLDCSGQVIDYERRGGLAFCLSAEEFEARAAKLQRLHNQFGADERDCEMLERSELERLMPNIAFGPDVAGASFCRRDAHVNPLQLLRAMHAAIGRLGGRIVPRRVTMVRPGDGGFQVEAGGRTHEASRIVVAAGIGSADIARLLGMDVPVRPQRGQVLVTQRLAPFLPFPASGLRQTAEGTVMIGATQEEVGLDTGTTVAAAGRLARKTTRLIPMLAGVALVRQWAGLRVMTADGYPVYAQSDRHAGAFVALCHSGVTLAAVHAAALADAVIAGSLPHSLDPFHQRRFDVSTAA